MFPELLAPVTIALFMLGLLGAGAIAGFIAGLLGVGGGIVVVMALYFILAAIGVDETLRMHVAVGTSLSCIVLTSLASAYAHNKRAKVDFALLKDWAPGIVIGVFAGSGLALLIDGRTLTAIFAGFAFVMSIYMAAAPLSWRVASEPPRGVLAKLIPAFIGGVSALMGIGGGTLSVPVLSLYGFPMHKAVSTAAAIGFMIGVPGTIGFIIGGWGEPGLPRFSLGYVNLLALILIIPTAIAFAPIGVRAAHALPVRGLRIAFAVFLAATAIRMFASVIG
jgi:uncharacterized membrane protein YfcA